MNKDRQNAWQAEYDAAQNHIKLGRSLQSRGMVLLNSIPIIDGVLDRTENNAADYAKLIQSASNAIDKGQKIAATALAVISQLIRDKERWIQR